MGAAHQLAKRGFYVFPCQKNGKKPLVKWKEESTTDAIKIAAWEKKYKGGNWGIDCGKSDIAVIDIDVATPGRVQSGFDSLDELNINKGLILPETMTFSTPSGGEHRVYKGQIKTGTGDLGPGLDTRGSGGYIIAPGSVIDGTPYRVQNNHEMVDIPPWIQEMTAPKRPHLSTNEDVLSDLPKNIEEATRFLTKRAPVAIEGQGGDSTTFKVIAQVRDYGVSEDKAVDLLLYHWNGRCQPPWDVDLLMRKAYNVYNYAQNSPGVATPQAVFEAPVESAFKQVEEKPEIELLPMMDLREALAPAPPQEWLIEGWIPDQEMCLFTGKEGTGKSLMALQLAMSAAYGLPWLGMELSKTYPVLYISCEDDKHEIQRRCNAISRLPEYAFLAGDVDPTRFRPVPLVGENNAMAYEDKWKLEAGPIYLRLNATLNYLGWKNPLIILDTLSDMFMANENNRALVQHFVKHYLGRFRRDYNATIITLAHPPKSESEYSGSTAWPAAHRSCIGVKKNPSRSLPDHRIVELWKANRATIEGKQFHAEWKSGAFVRVSEFDIPDIEAAAAAEDMERLYRVIVEKANSENELPCSIQPNAVNFIGKSRIAVRDSNNALMTKARKIELVNLLEARGRVATISGQDRKNGIFPITEEAI